MLDGAKRRLIGSLKREVPDARVIQAMERVPREAFVPKESRDLSYEDIALRIGEGQTVSQPFIIALMVGALELRRSDKVLELGTGSGYQAALLAEIARHVITVERVASLADTARSRLKSMGYTNVEVVDAATELGWRTKAPYDAIIVAAGAPKLPRELIDQLGSGGRLVVPVGSMEDQELMKVTRTHDTFSVHSLGACRFVPLIGDGAWPEE